MQKPRYDNSKEMHRNYIDELENKLCTWDWPSIIVGGLIATSVSLLLCNDAQADSIDLNLTSWHGDKTYKYNDINKSPLSNFGLGYTKDINHHWQGQVGFFKNSYNKNSLYVLTNLKHEMKRWNWGVAFGFVTGYDDIEENNGIASKNSIGHKSSYRRKHHRRNKGKVIPKHVHKDVSHSHAKNLNAIQFMILPNITWKITKKHALSLTYMPSFSKSTFAFAGLKYQYTIED